MYDEALATRIRRHLGGYDFTEIRMFGGLCIMVNGHMACGVVKDELLVRTGPGAFDESLAKPYARPMDLTGRPMRNIVTVGPAGLDDESLASWVHLGASFAASLPPRQRSGDGGSRSQDNHPGSITRPGAGWPTRPPR